MTGAEQRGYNGPMFELGRLVATPAALERAEEHGVNLLELLGRHIRGDWGDVPRADWRENDHSLLHGLRLFSAYGRRDNPARLWIITEADRSSTCILRPEDY